ncbi:MAG: thioredoxin domain-containing protein [Nanoarchaeota archaeon]
MEKKSETITLEKTTVWKIVTGILALLVILMYLNNGGTTTTTPGAQQPTIKTNVDMTVFADDIIKGSANAKVTIIEYSDPSCPFCAAAAGGSEMVAYMQSRGGTYEPALPGIFKNYVDTGKARFVFRYYPGHGKGQDAAKIMFCANEQNKFWEVHDVFFDNQKLMEAGDTAGLKKLAVNNGVDSSKLEACLATKKYDAKLTKDTQLGQAAGVGGTPSFAVNGQVIEGAVPFDTIQATIEAALR